MFVIFMALFCFFLCLSKFELGISIFASSLLVWRKERRVVSPWRRGLSLARASFPLGRPRPI
jgi:hypothetical protein